MRSFEEIDPLETVDGGGWSADLPVSVDAQTGFQPEPVLTAYRPPVAEPVESYPADPYAANTPPAEPLATIYEPPPVVTAPLAYQTAPAVYESAPKLSDPIETTKFETFEPVKDEPISDGGKVNYSIGIYEPAPIDPAPTYYEPAQQTPPIIEYPLPTVYEPEPKLMYPAPIEPVCNCIMEPCYCDDHSKIDPLPMPYEPAPVKVTPLPMPYEVPKGYTVTEPTPVMTAIATGGSGLTPAAGTVQTTATGGGTATGSGTPAVAGDTGDGEAMKILGMPWYYAVGIGAAALLLLSSTDGKN